MKPESAARSRTEGEPEGGIGAWVPAASRSTVANNARPELDRAIRATADAKGAPSSGEDNVTTVPSGGYRRFPESYTNARNASTTTPPCE